MASKKNDDTPAEDDTPVTPAATVETPAEPSKARATPLTLGRGAVAACVAGLLVVGGVTGFAIGRDTGDDGPRFGKVRPGGPGWEHGHGHRGRDNGRRQGGQRQNHGQPPRPQGGPQDVQPKTPQDGQAPADGSSSSGT